MGVDLKVLQWPHDALTEPTTPVQKVTPNLVDTAKQLYEVMKRENGIGLAANQVGLNISLIVMDYNGEMLALFNPSILARSKKLEYAPEGCLSFKGVSRLIKRPLEVTVKYRDITNEIKYAVLRNLHARVITHEIDHLKGITFLDYEEKLI